MTNTLDWYDRNATAYAAATMNVDMTSIRERFLAEIGRPKGDILDAGCGSGRDARAFSDLGYTVAAFDGSAEMANLASQRIGQPVRHLRLEELDGNGMYDGIWCCAALLHVEASALKHVFERLASALRPDGVLYLSVKAGSGERIEEGRRFTDLDEAALDHLLSALPDLALIETWRTAGRRPGREGTAWLNALIRKQNAL